jgi:hypothetical protein
MSKIKGLAIRGAAVGQEVEGSGDGPTIGGRMQTGYQILSDIFERLGDTQPDPQYLF